MKKIVAKLPGLARRSAHILAWLIVIVIGRWQWRAPSWVVWLKAKTAGSRRHLAANPKHATLLALVVVSIGGAYLWYASRPRQH